MRVRAWVAITLVAATLAVWVDPSGAAGGSVQIRRYRFVGLQMDVAEVRTGRRVVVEPEQAAGSVTTLRTVARICGGCIAGINGDFFDGSWQPTGGVIIHGVVLRSPDPGQNQLTFGPYGRISAGPMQWLGKISFGATELPVAVNDPDAGTPVLFDRHFSGRTPAGTATEFRFGLRRTAKLRIGRNVRLQYRGRHVPGRRILPGEVILRATGGYGQQLRDLKGQLDARSVRTSVSLATSPTAANSLGANHVILRGGQVPAFDENSGFVYGGHPRTIFGWNGRGKVWLVTIGSSTPGRRSGVSLPVAASLLRKLGATNAVNLDGGGSSTFVARGRIRNHPSDGGPRPVSNAWIVVRRRAG